MAKWWHSISSVLLLVLTAVAPPLQSLIAAHPTVAMVIASVWAILGHLMPSPVASSTTS